jgi:hypothetical protein
MTERILLLCVSACMAMMFSGCSGTADDPEAQKQIRAVLMKQFDRPESRLEVEPIVVQQDYGVASWSQRDRGGRALMKRTDGEWRIVLCSGDSLRDASKLAEMGLPAADAGKVAQRLIAAEAALAPERVARFSRFDGTVRMNQDGSHPVTDDHQHDHEHHAQ